LESVPERTKNISRSPMIIAKSTHGSGKGVFSDE